MGKDNVNQSKNIEEDYFTKYPLSFQVKGRSDELYEAHLKRIELQKDRIEQFSHQYQAAVNKIISKPKIGQGLMYLLPPAYFNGVQPLIGNHYIDLSDELSIEDLKSLHDPLIELNKIYFPNQLESHKFIEDRYVDLENELDLSQLKYDRKKYSIIFDNEYHITGKLNTSDDKVWIRPKYKYLFDSSLNGANPNWLEYRQWRYIDKFAKRCISYHDKWWFKHNGRWVGFQELTIDNINNFDKAEIANVEEATEITRISSCIMPGGDRYSITELYNHWLPTLTLDKIKGNDLLDQILICYTMKRALNGDRLAKDRLVEVLTPDSKTLYYIQGKTVKALSGKLKRELMKKFTKRYGSDEAEIKLLNYNTTIPTVQIDADEISSAINNLLPDLIGGMQPLKIIEGIIEKKESKQISPYPAKWFSNYYLIYLLFYVRFDYSDTPYGAINNTIRWKVGPHGTRWHKLNSYSFVPGNDSYKIGPKYNLHSWLFRESKILQILRDYYYPEIRYEKTATIYLRKFKGGKESANMHSDDVSKMIELLISYGISKTKAQIFSRCVLGEKKAKVARDYPGMYREKIYSIIKEVRQTLSKNPDLQRKFTSLDPPNSKLSDRNALLSTQKIKISNYNLSH